MLVDLANIFMLFIGLGMAASAILFIIVTIEDGYSRETRDEWQYWIKTRLEPFGRWKRVGMSKVHYSESLRRAEKSLRPREAMSKATKHPDIASLPKKEVV